MPRLSPPCVLIMAGILGFTACATPAEHRDAIEATGQAWMTKVGPDDQEDLIGHIQALAEAGRDTDDWPVSVALLSRVVLENPSGLVRAEALEAGWVLAAELPTEPLPQQGIPLDEFRGKVHRFEELEQADSAENRLELLDLAVFLASYRFPPTPDPRLRRLPLDLASLVSTRASWDDDESLRKAFAAGAAGSVRHALSLVTIYAADDVDPTVSEVSLRAARHLEAGAALNLITGTLKLEDHAQVLLAAVDSLDALSEQLTRRDVLATLSQIQPGSDLALRQAADALASRVGQ